ncbi:glycosyl Hydrolase Family 88 [Diaporthe helianthi]|uniref:Glycosyl Hydrolase Family 88 n=1 Tax=Diaporthe helianthi TaxID=158607 RepID=A0A2P5HFU0_DIAHE|nr:glycosyl Hydrolase Family 88 [Diaporthe helianthi]
MPSRLLTLAAAAMTASASARHAGGLAGEHAGTTKPLSTRMIESAISRQHGIVSSGASTSTLEAGILALATQAWLELYGADNNNNNNNNDTVPPEQVADFVSYVDDIITSVTSAPAFSNATAAALLPLDRLSVAQAINNLQEAPRGGGGAGGELTAAEALTLDTLNSSLALQRRNQAGGLFYYVYPYWSYLDGAASFLPYMAEEPSAAYSAADMLLQITLLYETCFQESTGLVVHGYDESKTAVWANNATGASPYVWGRSLGWYLAGLVNAWEVLTAEGGDGDCAGAGGGADGSCADLLAAIREQASTLMTNIARYADEETGVWWQLPAFPGREGNFLESSSTALYIFSILKGLRLGLLEDNSNQSLADVALRAYNYTTNEFVVDYGNGTLGWNGTVIVCSLNSTATYEYYTGRPIVFDAPLGEGAFVWASLEVERLGRA